MKKMISILLAFVLTLALLPLEVFADGVEDTATSGVTGSCVWSLDGTVLTISADGDGVMADYSITSGNATNTPWGNAITQVVIEDGVTVIGNYAFYYCLDLTQVTIPDSVTTINGYAFGECRNLSSVELPSRLITIGNYAFYSCESLASLDLPETVSTLGNSAFAYCDKLSTVTLPSSITTIGPRIFVGCTNLKTVVYPGTWEQFLLINGDDDNAELLNAMFMPNMEPFVIAAIGKAGMDLVWTNNPGADGFYVHRRDYKQGVWSDWTTIATLAKNVVTYTDSNVVNGGEYMYTVQAYKDDTMTPFLATAPCHYLTPTILEQTNTPSGVQLSWNKNDAAQGYVIYRYIWDDRQNNWVDENLVARTTDTSYVDKNVVHGKYYAYDVHAYIDESYSFVDYADEYGYIRHLTPPTVEVANRSDGIQVTWNDRGATYYVVRRRIYENGVWGEWHSRSPYWADNAFTDRTAEAGKIYQYAVRAVYKTYEDTFASADSITASVRRLIAPTVTIANAAKGIQLSWDKVAGADQYDIYRQLADGNWSKIETTAATGYIDTTAEDGISYTYRVKAVQGDSASVDSAPVSILRLTTPTVTVANVTKGIQLSWVNVTGADKYDIYRRLGNGEWSKIKTITATSYTDTTAKAGNSYTYQVRALQGDLVSADGTTASILRLTAPAVKTSNVTKGIQLSWNKVTGADKYDIYRRLGSGEWSKIKTITATDYIDTTTKAGKSYTYRIRAVQGNSISTDGITASIQRLTAPTVKTSNVTKGIQLSWNKVTGASKYYIYRRLGSGKWSKIKTTSATSYTDTGAKAGKSYTYRVRAVQGDSISAYKTTASILRLKRPGSVKLAKASKGFKVTWSKVTGAKKYEVYRRTGNRDWVKVKTTTSRNYTDKTAKKGRYYTYRVRAVSGSSKSAYKSSSKTKR